MNDQKIVFIGGGNMGRCLIAGLIVDGYSPRSIHVVDPDPKTRELLESQYQINLHEDPQAALVDAEIVVLAVKPQIMQLAINGMKRFLNASHPLLISIAAGIRTETLTKWLGSESPLVRTMPNTPAMVGSGATALYATKNVTDHQRSMAESVMRAVGITQWLNNEALMDVVTAVSGSGPAYFFRMMEAMAKAGENLGLTAEQARLLTIETAFGAAKMALESSSDPATLRKQVTSPGGTTERALKVFNEQDIDTIFEQALTAAKDRSEELAIELSNISGDS
ncbi:MAG: pyrroline-5-carboxylate reductase [Gammaproteobacteria bacterium]